MALSNALRSALRLNCNYNSFRLKLLENKVLNSYLGVSREKFLHVCYPLLKKQEVTIILEKGSEEIHIKGKEGDSVMDVIIDNNIDVPGYGACEGTLSCSTCHIKLSHDDFKKITLGASDEELDMLDMAPDVCETSRLGCQVYLSPALEGIRVRVPSQVKDIRDVPRAIA